MQRIRIGILVVATALAALGGTAGAAEFTGADFQGDALCRGCHNTLHESWRSSMHAKAFEDEIYQKTLKVAISDLGGENNPDAQAIQAFCLSCHTPIGTLTGDVPPKTAIAASGINCDFCHTVSDTNGIGNASYVNEPGNVKRGPFVDSISPSHDTTLSTLHTQSEFCGMCHDVIHPTNGLPLEQTYTEWKASPYPAKNVQCQHCMMGEIKNAQAAQMGPKRPVIFGHNFAGGNFVLGNKDEALKRLRSAATVTVTTDKQDAKPGDDVVISASLTNSGAGHKLPTGLTEARDMRLVINAVDEKGKTTQVFQEWFGTVLEDEKGNHEGVQVWRAVKIYSDNRLDPMERREFTKTFKIPANAKGNYKMEAVLKYRSATKEVTDHIDMEQLPYTVMASATTAVTLPGGEKEAAIENESRSSWIIWIGIGLFLILVGVGFYLVKRKPAK